jgi:ribonuclease HI
MSKTKSFYAVKNGRNTGIFTTWDECREQVNKFPNPIYKKFSTYDEADAYIKSSIMITPTIRTTTQSITTNDTKIRQELKTDSNVNVYVYKEPSNLRSNSYDINNDYPPLNQWNKFNGDLYIFTDGSNKGSIKAGNKMAGIGIYLSSEGLNIKNIYHGDEIMTNNRCELFAVLYSLQIIHKYIINGSIKGSINESINESIKSINIVSDSTYTVNSCNEWIEKWRVNGWKTANGTPVKNRDIMEDIYIYLRDIRILVFEKLNNKLAINIIHTNSHKNIDNIIDEYEKFLSIGNNLADKLAQNEL